MNFSSAYLTLLAFSLFPCLVKAQHFDWGGLTLIDDSPLFDPPSELFDPFEATLGAMLQRHQHVMDRAFSNAFSFPYLRGAAQIQLDNDPNQFQVALQVPAGLSPADVKVDFDSSTRLLTVSGHHEATDPMGYRSLSHFSQSFSLDPYVQVDQLKASIDGGVLRVTAPKKQEEHVVRSIPVIQALEIEAPPVEVEAPKEPKIDPVEEIEAKIEVPPVEEIPPVRLETPPVMAEIPPLRKNEAPASNDGDSFDPFRVKERVAKTLQKTFRQKKAVEPNASSIKLNPEEIMADPAKGYKSELRRRKLNRDSL